MLLPTKTPPPRWNSPCRSEGAYLTKRFCPVRKQGEHVRVAQLRLGRTNRSSSCNAKDLIQNGRTQIWVASKSLVLFRQLSVLDWGWLISYINIYHLSLGRYHIVFSPVFQFHLWRWNMTFLQSLIRNLKYVSDIVADGRSLYGERV